MFNVLLTQSTTPIIGPISRLFGVILDAIYNGLYSILGIENLAVTIIVFTVFTKLLLLPLAIKQQKSMRAMQLIQPEMKKIQDKYKNKKDAESQRKMNLEMTELYRKHNANPLGGCFTTLIQLPIIFALFDVLRNIPAYINSVKNLYSGIVTQIISVEGFADKLEGLADTLNYRLSGLEENQIISFLAQFKVNDWTELGNIFHQVSNTIQPNIAKIHDLNYFFGINLSEAPGFLFPGILIPIIAVAAQFLAQKTMTMSSTTDKATQQTQKTMMYFFPFLSGFFVVAMPAGLGIYWITTSIFQFFQQIYIHKYLNKEKEVK